MAKEKGNFRSCLSKTCHHAAPHKIGLILHSVENAEQLQEELEYRFQLIVDNLTNAISQLDKVADAVNRGDIQGARDAFNESIEFGHNWPEPA